MSDRPYEVIGTRPVRHDGADKVTGRAKFGADVRLPGMVYGYVLRSPHAHARIRRLDTTRAEQFPGVLAVVTAADLPESPDRPVDLVEGTLPLRYVRANVLARDKVLYKGHAVAAVAAVNRHVAEEAASLIEVDYEPLPAVLDVLGAMREDAPRVHEDLRMREFGETTERAGNIAEHFRFVLGEVEPSPTGEGLVPKGFADADVIVEREFRTAMVHQGYLEPQNATALWNQDGRVYVWTSTQGAFSAREAIAWVLDLPVSRVCVYPMEVGGAFGGKIRIYLEPVAALLSRKCGRPVQIVMPRRDVFEATGPTPGTVIRVKMGARKDGRISAAQVWMAYETGAFPSGQCAFGAMCILAPYDIPNLVIDGYDVVVNKPSTAPYRAPGATQAAFAAESVVDELAEKLGMDPIEFRLKNAAREGTRRADGPKHARIGCVEVLEAMRNHPHYRAPLEGQNRGRGVALGYWFNIGWYSACTISVNPDGTVNLVEGSVDLSGTRTSIAMQAAEVLGLRPDQVHPVVADTDSIGPTAVTGGSRTTYATGWAAYEAAHDVIRQMKQRAAMIWDVEPAAISFERGVFRTGERTMTFAELAARLEETGGPVIGRGAVNPASAGGSFAGAIADVEVDPGTGKVRLLRFTSLQDAGRAVHPTAVEGQMQGGSAQGIGWALFEEYAWTAEGAMANSSLLDYREPTALDVPPIETVIVEVPDPEHPFGVRGVGEANIVPPPAAIANAVYRAVGVRLRQLPLKASALVDALRAREN
ncbi:MAG: xanthine dehydrogenase family protein molybdopterin-binding subunit [Bryobacterales bacterium]|nr:xanthine dehydrogenase family protein molybdopterin-binding subunit [Bryobacteraceae bacterium]MDW8129582.1 xanthine dehydrogenase family protein molybdopterin-binding subunit [Bryobacterales bacterium]